MEQLIQNKPEKEKLALWEMASTMPRCFAGQTSALLWALWVLTLPVEAADVVLMDDDPMQISKAIKISASVGIVYQNIVVAIGVKLACLVLIALGFANMWLAVFADVA